MGVFCARRIRFISALMIALGLVASVACSSANTQVSPTPSETGGAASAGATPASVSIPTPIPILGPSNTPTTRLAVGTGPTPEATATKQTSDHPQALMDAIFEMSLIDVARQMAYSGNPSYIPLLIDFMRFLPRQDEAKASLASYLARLTGQPHGLAKPEQLSWNWWVEWLGNHPEVQGPEGYAAWKSRLLSFLDPEMGAFLYDGVKTRIRLEEIVWGGVAKDGIPDLTDPSVVSAGEAIYLSPSDRVFGVSVNGEHRAYPLRVLNPHEMANDIVGGMPIVLAY